MAETAVVTLLFCDLVGSTELLNQLGDDANDEVRRSLLAALGRAADAYGGTVVKTAGDGLMVSFGRSAADAVACAAAMQRAAAQVEHNGEALGLQLRVGISSGEASHEDGDWFGTPVVEAARLEAAARPGQILVSDVVRTIVGTRGGARFRDAGKRDFKGFPRPVPVIEVVWRSEADPRPRPRRKARASRRRLLTMAAFVALLAAIAAAAIVPVMVLSDSSETNDLAAERPLVAEGYVPLLEPRECDPSWELGPEVRCEELVVPESRESPAARTVRITAITYPSRVSAGGTPTITLGGFGDTFEESDVRQYGDLVSLDLRGGTLATPTLLCPEVAAVQRRLLETGSTRGDPVWLDAARQCGERLRSEGNDLNRYGLNDMMNDLRDFLIAKGWQHVNLQANAEWSRIAILFAQQFPQSVRALVIADPLPFDAPENDIIIHVNGAFQAYVDECRANEDCQRAFADLAEIPERIHASYEETPAVIPVADPGGGPDIRVQLDGDALMYALALALNDAGALRVMPAILSAGGGPMENTAAAFLVDNTPLTADVPWGLWNSLFCEDIEPLVSRSGTEAAAAVYPIFSGLARPNDVCTAWPTEADSALDREIRVSAAPALILAGELSPWFPPAFAESAAEAFEHARVVTFPHLPGGVIESGNQCVSDLRLTFLRDPRAELDAEACVRSIPPIQFEGT